MKHIFFLGMVLVSAVSHLQGQTESNEAVVNEYVPAWNNASNPCITTEQYKIMEQRCKENAELYNPSVARRISSTPVLYYWPLKEASGFTDCSYYFIAAYVDQDTNVTTFKDYNCGTNTYDGHRGTDIAMEPFPFYKMDNRQVEVIAAAAGTIIDKHDGEYDRNCVGSGSNIPANYVIIQHSDGSVALYWHMKKNSVTSKALGQTVVAGEQLGIVGSSGSSSGPHLHFEVWATTTANTLRDPFTGTCNKLNASSLWVSQHVYLEPAVVKASVHTQDITFPACGTTEVPDESTSFTIPFQGPGLPPGYAKFYVFLRDMTNGTTANMTILNPNSTNFVTPWSFTANTNYNFSYLFYSKVLPTIAGTYTFNATYNGVTCTQSFDIVTAVDVKEEEGNKEDLSVYPNPVVNELKIMNPLSGVTGAVCSIINTVGQTVFQSTVIRNPSSINVSSLSPGLYFLKTSDEKQVRIVKFVKQ